MERQRTNSFLAFFAVGVFGFGLATWASIVPNTETKTVFSTERNPSSIPPGAVQKNAPGQFAMLNHLVKLDLSCKKLESKKTYVVKGGYIQLNGKNCVKPKSFNAIKISNQTNGFQASFFDAGQGQYRTDLIQLSEGENKIQIEYVNSGGQKTEMSVLVTSRRI